MGVGFFRGFELVEGEDFVDYGLFLGGGCAGGHVGCMFCLWLGGVNEGREVLVEDMRNLLWDLPGERVDLYAPIHGEPLRRRKS